MVPALRGPMRLSRPRAAGILLALLGLAPLGYALAFEPAPRSLDDLIGKGPPASGLPPRMLARGPAAHASYDAANDTTLAVFRCSHWTCPTAVLLSGDQREAALRDGLLLVLREGGTASRVPLDEPIPIPRAAQPVATRLDATFDVGPRWPGLLARAVGATALLVGVALAVGLPALAAGVAGSALFLAAVFASGNAAYLILSQIFLVPMTLLGGLVLLVVSTQRPALRPWAFALLAYLPTLVVAFVVGVPAYVPTEGP